jgi:endoglucanase
MKDLIKKLVETTGPSGYEGEVRNFVRQEVESLVDELRVDNMGNLIVRKGEPGPDGKKVMLSAHMDEIGIMATHIDENGFIRFAPIGGVFPRHCIGGRVRFLNGTAGVIGAERIQDPLKLPGLEGMFIDVGAASRQDCPVRVGDVAAFDRPFEDLGKRLVSKAMDDRIGVAILVEALRQISQGNFQIPHQVWFVFSVQEEVGLRGATTAAYGVDPDVGLAVDITTTGDTPKGVKMAVGIGKGPAIKVRDSSMLADPRVVDWMVKAAEKLGMPYQLEVLEHGGTDAHAIQLTRSGVPAGCLSIPTRYAHSPSEMVDWDDVQNCVKLLVELVCNPISLEQL